MAAARRRRSRRRSDFKIFSQNGEDGILLHIFRNIGATNRWFVEVWLVHACWPVMACTQACLGFRHE